MAKMKKKAASKKMTLDGAKKVHQEAVALRERVERAYDVLNAESEKIRSRLEEIDQIIYELEDF